MHLILVSQRRPPLAFCVALTFALAMTLPLNALCGQQTTQQKRDSIARADSIRHAMHDMPGMTPGTTAGDTTAMHGTMPMSMMVPDPPGISMERMGSGTTWIPDAISLPSRHYMRGAWDLMLHGFMFAQYDHQNGPRGGNQLGSLNWAMFMASHELAGGRLQARTMLSLDPATVSARGYPLLLQSGESYRGKPLHDRQHPHDFWMELAAMYERPVSDHVGIMLYVAPSGEPALGPVAFMHRPSAMDNPTAPLSHHWQDATHVSFGVFTAGLFTHDWKLEGSIFNGREPDEHRWNFDPIRFDSYSGRLSFNPTRTWALSAGYGYIKSIEALQPDEQTHRVTASAMHAFGLGAMATLNVVPAALESPYGSRTPIGTLIFLRLRPFHLHPMEMKPMSGMK